MGFTDIGKNQMLERVLKDKQVQIGLHTEEGEVKATEYERQNIKWHLAENGQIVSSEEIFFPIAKSSWGIITDIAIYDTEENIIATASPEWKKNIEAGSQYYIGAGMAIARIL